MRKYGWCGWSPVEPIVVLDKHNRLLHCKYKNSGKREGADKGAYPLRIVGEVSEIHSWTSHDKTFSAVDLPLLLLLLLLLWLASTVMLIDDITQKLYGRLHYHTSHVSFAGPLLAIQKRCENKSVALKSNYRSALPLLNTFYHSTGLATGRLI